MMTINDIEVLLSEDEVWEWELKQWEFIAKEVKAGTVLPVEDLKHKFMEDNGIDEVISDCFFCEYRNTSKRGNCNECLGALADHDAFVPHKGMWCCTAEFNYYDKPLKFYKRLKKLYKERKESNNDSKHA